MSRLRHLVIFLSAAAALGACTNGDGPSDSTHLQGKVVTPRPGTESPHVIEWEGVTPTERGVAVHYFGGDPTCTDLDHVDVVETDTRIEITVYEGRRRAAGPCPLGATLKTVVVDLREAVGTRSIVDGGTGI